MISDAWLRMEKTESQELSNSQMTKYPETGRHAPYMLQNLTTEPLSFCVCQRGLKSYDLDVAPSSGVLQPGGSTNIYITELPEELFRYRPVVQPSDRLNDKQLLEAAHQYVTFQLEGTAAPSIPISMDLVGRRYFEVELSKSSHGSDVHTDDANINAEGGSGVVAARGFVIPMVVDVSVQSLTKLIRLYSTVCINPGLVQYEFFGTLIFLQILCFQVLILNTTSIPLEVRFDIPLGVSPKVI